MIFRKLTREDAAAYWAARLEALEKEPLAFGMTPEEHRRTTNEDAEAVICDRGGFILGAFDAGALVGMARFVREQGEKERHKGHVYGVYMHAAYRGRGVARSLIAALVAAVREEPGMEQLLLSAAVHNEGARNLYRAVGFVGFGIEPRALKVGDGYIDEEHMILRL